MVGCLPLCGSDTTEEEIIRELSWYRRVCSQDQKNLFTDWWRKANEICRRFSGQCAQEVGRKSMFDHYPSAREVLTRRSSFGFWPERIVSMGLTSAEKDRICTAGHSCHEHSCSGVP